MFKKTNIALIAILSVAPPAIFCAPANAGGPFSNPNSLGDVMMVMAPAYALGMTVMARDWVGTLELGGSVLAAQLASEGIKALELERRPNGSDWQIFFYASSWNGHCFPHQTTPLFFHRIIPDTRTFLSLPFVSIFIAANVEIKFRIPASRK